MGLYDEFRFKPASWLPHSELSLEEFERIRNIKREDMEYTNENGYSVRIVPEPNLHIALDIFYHLVESDKMDKKFTMICPNQWTGCYSAVANLVNKHNINLRNVNAFAMDEWADQDGNVAPLTYGAGLGFSFMHHFYYLIREDLRPDISQWHTHNNQNKGYGVYSRMIEDCGGADMLYSATGWPGHTAFIDPRTEEFKADSIEEFIKIKSTMVTQSPLTISENSLFAPMGASGDVWAVPPKAITIGPYDVVNARERMEAHAFVNNQGGDTWQRMVSRLQLYGPISVECPASIMRLGKGNCFVSEAIAKPFGSWSFEEQNYKNYEQHDIK